MNNQAKKVVSALSICLILGGFSAGFLGAYVFKCEEVTKLQLSVSEYKKELNRTAIEHEGELKVRDNTLDEYRREMDKKDKEIERLEKIEKAHKECPTREELEKQKQSRTMSVSRGGATRGTPIQMTLTFYGDSAAENGGYAGMDAQGGKLRAGTVASNSYPFGTQFSWGGQTYTVRDRGGSNFNSPNRLDVFVPRNSGESESSYNARIRQYGKRTITVYKH